MNISLSYISLAAGIFMCAKTAHSQSIPVERVTMPDVGSGSFFIIEERDTAGFYRRTYVVPGDLRSVPPVGKIMPKAKQATLHKMDPVNHTHQPEMGEFMPDLAFPGPFMGKPVNRPPWFGPSMPFK
ncbi:hypothetical protein [Spirosoma aerophilum]